MKDEEIKEMLFKMTRTTDGRVFHGFQDLDEAVRRYKYFKEWLKTEIPDFTEQEIVKYWRKYGQIKKVFDWSSVDEFLRILEKENSNVK